MVNSLDYRCMWARLALTGSRWLRCVLLGAFALLVSGALTACGPKRASILLFAGTGSSANDVAAVKTILNSGHLDYSTVNSLQLNSMAASEMSAYRLLIIPGGNFVDMGNSLTEGTTANVHNAVNAGLSYLGVCAGGFLAGSFPALYKSFNLSSGVKFGFYSTASRKLVVRVIPAEGPELDRYWEEGPQFSGWGQVIATYPDGTPAIVQGSLGQGRILLTGVHPEAPTNWRRGLAFATPVSNDTAYARTLVMAALNRVELPHD